MTGKTLSIEQIRAMSEQERRRLYDRAAQDPRGAYIVEMMDSNGLKPKPKLMEFTNPIYRKMVEIAKSSQGKAAMEEAAENGQPAICGLDRLLQNRLGKDYSDSTTPGTIMSAGSLAAELMPKLGYVNAGKRKCPDGCIAKEGILWIKD